jgi:hypothetical protein
MNQVAIVVDGYLSMLQLLKLQFAERRQVIPRDCLCVVTIEWQLFVDMIDCQRIAQKNGRR